MGGNPIWHKIVKEAFKNNQGIKVGNPDCIQGSGNPDTVVTGREGLLYWDYTNSIAYVCEDDSTNWLPISV